MKRTDTKEKKNKKKKKVKETSVMYRICYAIFSGIVGFLFQIRVVGEPEPEEGRFIVCANHIAASDPVVLCYAFRKHQVRFMAKKELFKIPLLAQLIRMLGAFPIDRGGNDVGAVKKAVAMVKEGKCMGIFPQGHRYPGKNPRETSTKNGAALICTRAQADVIPAYLYCKDRTPKLFRRTYVIIGKRIPYEEFAYDSEQSGEYARITEMIFDRVCALGEGFAPPEKKKRKK